MQWLRTLFGFEPDSYKKHDEPLLEGGHVEEDDLMTEEERRALELNFVKRIFVSAGGGKDASVMNFYFDMFTTEEQEMNSPQLVRVWWMCRDHPYVFVIRAERERIWRESRKRIYSPFRLVRPNVVAFAEDAVEMAVDSCIKLCAEYKFVNVHEDEPNNSPNVEEQVNQLEKNGI